MIALSFLGTGEYGKTTYVWQDSACTTSLFPHAVNELFAPDRLLVAMTAEARTEHHDALDACCSFETLDIPSGESEDEVWQMFQVLADNVPEGATLMMDITHGFRAQPVVALAAGLLLRAARDVTIERIVYGAYEARDKASNKTPIFDLTPFLDLIDWANATRLLLRHGNAAPLREIIQEVHASTYKAQAEYKAEGLYHVGNALGNLTEALSVIRPSDTLTRARKLSDQFGRAEEDLKHLSQARPLSLLLDKIESRFAPMAGDDLFTPEGFRAQAAIIDFYLETEQYAQAVLLAREMVVSKVCIDRFLDPGSKAERYQGTCYLGGLADTRKEGRATDNDTLADLWTALADVRNDLAHAATGSEPLSASTMVKRVEEVCDEVCRYVTP